MEIHEKIADLVKKSKTKWTADDKEFIVGLCADNGISINPLCPDCYKDAAVQLYTIYKPKEEKTAGGYALRDGVDVMHHAGGRVYHVCAATLTEESAREWIEAGLPLSYFAQLPE